MDISDDAGKWLPVDCLLDFPVVTIPHTRTLAISIIDGFVHRRLGSFSQHLESSHTRLDQVFSDSAVRPQFVQFLLPVDDFVISVRMGLIEQYRGSPNKHPC